MKELIILGSGGHARAAISVARATGKYDIKYILDLDVQRGASNEFILGIRVENMSTIDGFASMEDYVCFIAVGCNKKRRLVYEEIAKSGLSVASLIHPSAIIGEGSQIGLGTFVGAHAHIGPEVVIGECSIVNTFANIEHESIVGKFCHISPSATICGRCQIGNQVLVGTNCSVLPNRKVANDVLLGAGAVVTTDLLKEGCRYVGIPARQK